MSRMVGKDTITGMGFIGLEHGRLYKMRRGPKVITATITGRRIVLEKCAGGKLRGLILYGKSTQVTTTGAQLLTSAVIKGENYGVTLTKKDSVWHLEGTNTAGGVRNIRLMEPKEHFKLPAGTYTLSFSKDGVFPIGINIAISKVANPDISSEQIWTGIGNAGLNTPTKFVLDGTEEALSIFVNFPAGKYISCDLYVMLNAGDTALPWEPYTGGKPSPSPDYPQKIQSAKSEVVVHGKNLFGGRFYYANYSNDVLKIDGSRKENEVELPFAPTYETFGICKALKCRKGKTYIISVTNPNKNAVVGMAEYETIEKAIDINNALGFVGMSYNALKKSYIAKSDGILACGIAGTWTDGKTTLHECTESELLQVEEAMEATDYEPYRTPQTLTLTSPTSLPGIQVYSGGNYTDPTGQQWICDEVDLERGVYVQRINERALAQLPFSYEKTPVNHNDTFVASIDEQLSGTETGHAMCQYAFFDGVSYELAMQEDCRCYVWRNNVTIQFRDSVGVNTLEAFAEWLISHPKASISYVLATPIETPLSETDIAAYRALTIYDPTTVVETNSGGLKVSYNKIVEKD